MTSKEVLHIDHEHSLDLKIFGSMVRELRAAQDKPVATVASDVGISESYVRMIETGTKAASFGTAYRVLVSLGVLAVRTPDGVDIGLPYSCLLRKTRSASPPRMVSMASLDSRIDRLEELADRIDALLTKHESLLSG